MPRVLILASLCLFFIIPAFAAQSPWMAQDYMKVRLLSAHSGTGDLKEIEAALEVDLTEGWYTYWRMAGDAGLPPTFDWSPSKNVKEVRVRYPIPQRFETEGMNSFGYKGTVLFPLTVIPETPGAEISLAVKMDSVVCHDICVPQHHEVTLKLPAEKALRTEHNFHIEQAFQALPYTEDQDDLQLSTAVLGKEAVVVTAFAREGFDLTDVIVEVPGGFLTAPPEIMIGDDPKRGVFKVAAPEMVKDLTTELLGKKVTVTLINREQAIEKEFQF